jgi:hypothetical protein
MWHAGIDVDMANDMAVDMDANVADDSPCFNGPAWSGPNIFGLLIWIQLILRIQSIFIFQATFKIESNFIIQPIFEIESIFKIEPILGIQAIFRIQPIFKI